MTKKLWGGRFSKKTDPLAEEWTKSIQYDYKLAKWDIFGSALHVKILLRSDFLTSNEAEKLISGLFTIGDKIEKGKLKIGQKQEDIHTFIQNELQKEVGDLALKLHTARSRNDQVALSTKMYCKESIKNICNEISNLKSSIEELITQKSDIIISGFTHMQHAQPVYLKDYLGTYMVMLERDIERFNYISKNMKITMGAGALAGTPISASKYSETLKDVLDNEARKLKELFNISPTTNSLDSVSDRDFVIEIISALSLVATHLSRLAEDLIIWSTKEFDFVEIDEAFCTGSSLMPQKKNPDVLELIRGYAGRLYGNLVSVLTMMKGLPLTYNRDMQLDKEPLFNSFEIVSSELKVLAGLMKTLKFNKEKIKEQLKDESLYATDLVYYLVIEKKEPFAIAHATIGKLVRYSLDNGVLIKDMTQDQLDKFSKKLIKDEIVRLFDPKISVESKKSILRKGS